MQITAFAGRITAFAGAWRSRSRSRRLFPRARKNSGPAREKEFDCGRLRAAVEAMPRRQLGLRCGSPASCAWTSTGWPPAPTRSAATISNSCSSVRRRRRNAAASSNGSPTCARNMTPLRVRGGDIGRRQALVAQFREQCGGEPLPGDQTPGRRRARPAPARRQRSGLRAQMRRLLLSAHARHGQRAERAIARPLPGALPRRRGRPSIPARPTPTSPPRSQPIRASATTTFRPRSISRKSSIPPAPARSPARAGRSCWAAPSRF